MSPTIGPSGNPYFNIQRNNPVEVESLECISIFSSKKNLCQKHILSNKIKKETYQKKHDNSRLFSEKSSGTNLNLEILISKNNQLKLNKPEKIKDRSECLTSVATDLLGWSNFFKKFDILHDNPDNIIYKFGSNLGLDDSKIERILNTIDSDLCEPHLKKASSELKCWDKIKNVNDAIYKKFCPLEYQEYQSIYRHIPNKENIIEINNKFINSNLIPNTGIVGIKSAKGTGKTQAIRIVTESSKKVVYLTARNSLNKSAATNLNLQFHHDVKDLEKVNRVAITPDSLYKLNPANFKDGDLVIDEAKQFFSTLMTGKTLKNNRKKSL